MSGIAAAPALVAPKMILIDLDGTMVDSVPDLAYSVDRMCEELGLPLRGEARVRNWVGNGVERLVKRALTDSLDGEPDQALFDRALPVFSAYYKDNTSQRSCLYAGVAEGLEALRRAGYALGCVTNKPAQFTLPLLKAMGIYDYFGIVVSGDTLPVRKPDPAPLFHAAKYFGVDPSDALMIGDSISDVKAARNAGFRIACVTYGYNHGKDIREASPDIVVDSIAELAAILARA